MFESKKTLKDIKCYSIDEFYPDCILKLDSNENVFGPSENVISAFKNIDIKRFNLYPCYGELLNVLSERFSFGKENFILTNGCDEAINVVLSAYLNANEEILSVSPTFSMPLLYSKIIGAKCYKVIYDDKWKFSKDMLLSNLKENTKVIYLASPNNPTGDIIEPCIVEEILQQCNNNIILLDLTYVNYSDYDERDYYNIVKKYKNLVCVKSFSKDYALAGLRLGFILASEEMILEFKKVISPYSVNSLAVYAGIKALEDKKHFASIRLEVQKSKEFLMNELRLLGFMPYESQANFVLVNFGEHAEFAYNKLSKEGIKVRKFASEELKTCLRIGIPSVLDAKKIIAALTPRKLLVFDLDGVVFDVSNSYRYAIQKTFEYFAHEECKPCEMQEAKNRGGLSNDWDLTKFLLDKKGISANYSELVTVFQDIFYNPEKSGPKGAIDNEKLVLDAKFFQELSKTYDLAVFTGRPKAEAFYSLKKFNLDKYFQYFVCLEDVENGKSKPYPDGLLKIKKNCFYTDLCFFGDTVDDAKSARDADVLMYGIIPPNAVSIEHTKENLKNFGAYDVIDNARDILNRNLFKEMEKCQ